MLGFLLPLASPLLPSPQLALPAIAPSHATLAHPEVVASLAARSFVPLSFSVPNLKLLKSEPMSSPAWRCVVLAHELVGRGSDPRVDYDQSAANLWLLKPTNGSGGEGISIASEIEELERDLGNAKSSTHGFIVQKYLEDPLLYDGRKFDLRVWAVVASDPGSQAGLRIYAYREGYARTSSEAFSLPTRGSRGGGGGGGGGTTPAEEAEATHERLVHLTNYCMQVHGENCGQHEEGNAISFDDLGSSSPAINFRSDVLPRLYALVVDAVLAARKELLSGLREHGGGRGVCALLGYDFMISASGRPYLIECNANPLIAAQNPWHDLLVARMIDDYVSLAADSNFFDLRDAPPPLPRPPLDGTHCKEFDGTGFLLLAGRPTPTHPTPMYGFATFGASLVLERSAEERKQAAAVDEPPPPGPPPIGSPPTSPTTPPAGYRYRSRARSRSPTAERMSAASDRVRNDAISAAAGAEKRRLAATKFAAAHRAAAAASMPTTSSRPRSFQVAVDTASEHSQHGAAASSRPGSSMTFIDLGRQKSGEQAAKDARHSHRAK